MLKGLDWGREDRGGIATPSTLVGCPTEQDLHRGRDDIRGGIRR